MPNLDYKGAGYSRRYYIIFTNGTGSPLPYDLISMSEKKAARFSARRSKIVIDLMYRYSRKRKWE